MILNQLTALFTHATKIYDLANNPCKKVKRMGKDDKRSLTFWTVDEYKKFISTVDKSDRYYIMFEILFWSCWLYQSQILIFIITESIYQILILGQMGRI